MPPLPNGKSRRFGLALAREQSFPVARHARRALSRREIREIPNHFADEKVSAQPIQSGPVRLQRGRLVIFGEHNGRQSVKPVHGARAEL